MEVWRRGCALLVTVGGLLGVGLSVRGMDAAGPAALAVEPQAAGGAGQGTGKVPGKKNVASTTPVQDTNTKGMSKIKKGETVKGGEASQGPTPSDEFWLPSNKALIKDEPLTVEVPAGLPELFVKVNVPVSNPITKGKYELGRQLYFEPRISLDGTVSCATCHNPAKGWTDGMAVSTGIDGQTGDRSAPTVINTVYGKTMFWDGRAPSLEAQAQGPIQNSIEMGKQSYRQIIERLRAIPGYKEQFEKVFGTTVTLDGMAKAIATFERVAALSGNSKYDKYSKGEVDTLNESEKRGMILCGSIPRMSSGATRCFRKPNARYAIPVSTSVTNSFTTWVLVSTPRQTSSPTSAAGRSIRLATRMMPTWARSRRRRSGISWTRHLTCTTAAWELLKR
jgi:cytochrome c peroxidase